MHLGLVRVRRRSGLGQGADQRVGRPRARALRGLRAHLALSAAGGLCLALHAAPRMEGTDSGPNTHGEGGESDTKGGLQGEVVKGMALMGGSLEFDHPKEPFLWTSAALFKLQVSEGRRGSLGEEGR